MNSFNNDNESITEPLPLSFSDNPANDIQEIKNNPAADIFLNLFSNDDDQPMPTDNTANTPARLAHKARSWTEDEDKILLNALTGKNPKKINYTSISTLLPQHTSQSIRERWINHLNPILNKSPFSYDEYDQIKVAVEKHGRKWAQISSEVFGSTRAVSDLKNQFKSVQFKVYISHKYGTQTYDQLQGK